MMTPSKFVAIVFRRLNSRRSLSQPTWAAVTREGACVLPDAIFRLRRSLLDRVAEFFERPDGSRALRELPMRRPWSRQNVKSGDGGGDKNEL